MAFIGGYFTPEGSVNEIWMDGIDREIIKVILEQELRA